MNNSTTCTFVKNKKIVLHLQFSLSGCWCLQSGLSIGACLLAYELVPTVQAYQLVSTIQAYHLMPTVQAYQLVSTIQAYYLVHGVQSYQLVPAVQAIS